MALRGSDFPCTPFLGQGGTFIWLNEKEGYIGRFRGGNSVQSILRLKTLLVYYENERERRRVYFYPYLGIISFFVH